ncbi:MAG: hypothetical protein IKP40_07310 [Clostridia bacterium]|nr:hypothetical protein [Clostridia bacterium]
MKPRLLSALLCAVLLLALCAVTTAALGETMTFGNISQALDYVKKNQPKSLELTDVRFSPKDLLKLKNSMPEGSKLKFSTTWCGTTITQNSRDINLNNSKAGVGQEDVEALITLCPKLKKLNFSSHHNLSNKIVIPLIEKYPDIEFVWFVVIRGNKSLCSDDSAYSTFNKPNEQIIHSADLEVLKYCPNIKALDLGHNYIDDLSFLQYCPDLEMLILGQNPVTDLTWIGTLKHLKYAELFSLKATDCSPLANCTELLDLNLSYCPMTDLTPLQSLTKLERFWGNKMSKLPEDQKTQFAADHPDCLCVFKGGHATSDNWRKHERYDHYIWCLKAHEWIPFEEPLPNRSPY